LLVERDHRGNPARGIDNINDFASMKNLVAVIGGLHTPVAMAEMDIIHEKKMIYLCPWAAGTPIIENNHHPNYVFRVSVRDEYAGGFLVEKLIEAGYHNPALLLEQTGWGRSNLQAMTVALKEKGIAPTGVYWFNWGVRDLRNQILSAKNAGADILLLVANSPEGVVAIKSMNSLARAEQLPILSHWGITGGSFFEQTRTWLNGIRLWFLQTYSFFSPTSSNRNQKVIQAYCNKYPDADSASDIFAPAGTAHAYDLVFLLAKAIETAGSINRETVQKSLEKIHMYKGLVRSYDPPFSPKMHDALDVMDFKLARYDHNGVIVPITLDQLK